RRRRAGASLFALLLGVLPLVAADTDPFSMHDAPSIAGRWDLKVRDGVLAYPSWLEVEQSGYRTLVGRYVGQFGSARPIGQIEFDRASGKFRFAVPPQWERRTSDVVFEGRIEGDVLRGETTNDQGRTIEFEGRRAPALERSKPPTWGAPVKLFNGRDL
ncbi:MAG TPA: DUF1080 domain-containing protein, partial [Verrucomicrobiales bacterium]|nr:DUF1080 domain-containing protein [Verrucomicrobiales bacterium]